MGVHHLWLATERSGQEVTDLGLAGEARVTYRCRHTPYGQHLLTVTATGPV